MRKTTPLEHALSLDPIHEFEKVTGKHYRENTDAENRALLAFAMDFNTQKAALIERAGDTTFSMDAEAYAANITAFGFREIYTEPFMHARDGEARDEVLKVYWHEDGLLLCCDTFRGRRNAAKVWYNWQHPADLDSTTCCQCTSSGGYIRVAEDAPERIWAGDHDAREAIRSKIRRLRECGTLLNPWRQQPPAVWLCHYGDDCDGWQDYEAVSRRRLDRLPQDIQAAILHNLKGS